jgi:hypothetical protein
LGFKALLPTENLPPSTYPPDLIKKQNPRNSRENSLISSKKSQKLRIEEEKSNVQALLHS